MCILRNFRPQARAFTIKLNPSEEQILKNAHLKSIVAETSEILPYLENEASLQIAYWRVN